MNPTGLLIRIVVLDTLGVGCLAAGIGLAHSEVLPPEKGFLLAQIGGALMFVSLLTANLLVYRRGGLIAALFMFAILCAGLGFAATRSGRAKARRSAWVSASKA